MGELAHFYSQLELQIELLNSASAGCNSGSSNERECLTLAPSTASDFRDTLAQEILIQFSGFGLNWQMDGIGDKRQVNPDNLSCHHK